MFLAAGLKSSFIFFMACFIWSGLMDWISSLFLWSMAWKKHSHMIDYCENIMFSGWAGPTLVFLGPVFELLLSKPDLPLTCLQIQPHMGTCWHCLAFVDTHTHQNCPPSVTLVNIRTVQNITVPGLSVCHCGVVWTTSTSSSSFTVASSSSSLNAPSVLSTTVRADSVCSEVQKEQSGMGS